MSLPPEIRIVQDVSRWAAEAANFILKLQRQVVGERGRFVVALSGGQTPKLVYEQLVLASRNERDAWRSTHFLFSDERCVPPSILTVISVLPKRRSFVRSTFARIVFTA